MPIQELLNLKHSGSSMKKTSIMMAVHCAPLIMGSKAANIITVTGEEFVRIRNLICGTGISYFLLKLIPRSGSGASFSGDENKYILYLYREDALSEYLGREDVREFLSEQGYDCGEKLVSMLIRLSRRILSYCDGKIEFPHEIGAFLEYPVWDIRGFLLNEGRNFKLSGYWKVYDNVKQAKELFARFDAERELIIQEILNGRTIREIAV